MEISACFKEFAKYSSLNMFGILGLSCYILADTFFVAQGLGANGLTALNLAIPIYSCIHGSGLMLGMGGATKYIIFKSQCEPKKANAVFTHTFMFAAILASAFFLIGTFCSDAISTLLGADSEVFSMTNTYLKVLLLFAPAFICNDILICFVRNDGNPRLSMLAMVGGSLANILLDYIFIFPLQMGILGAVSATGLAPLLSMLILSRHWLAKKHGFHFAETKPDFQIAKSILSLGFPSLITEVSSGIVIVVFNTILLKLLGNVGVAAYGVIANLSLVVIAIYTGIAQGIQPLISRAYGCHNALNIKQVLRYAMITMLIFSGVIYLIMLFGANPITNIFNSENNIQLREIAAVGLKLYFTSVVFVGFNIIISVFFTSTERATPAHLISLLRGLFVIVPMAFLLSMAWRPIGVWLAFPFTELLVAILGAVMCRVLKNR